MVISQSKELIDGMDEWNQEISPALGLIDGVLASKTSEQEAEQRTLEFIKQHVGKNESPLSGNTVGMIENF